jgi:hypothetical protein
VDVNRLPCAIADVIAFFVACKVAFAFYVIICLTVSREMIDAKKFVDVSVLLQPTCITKYDITGFIKSVDILSLYHIHY